MVKKRFLNIFLINCGFREKIQEISFDHEGNNFDFLNEESFLEPDFYYSFKDEEINIPEPNFTNLTQIAKNISVDFS